MFKKQLNTNTLKKVMGGKEDINVDETDIWFKPLDETSNTNTSRSISGAGIGGKDLKNAGPQILIDDDNL